MRNDSEVSRTRARIGSFVLLGLALGACNGGGGAEGGTSASGPSTPPGASTSPSTTIVPSTGGLVFGLLGPGAGLLDELAVAQRNAAILAIDDITAGGGVLGQPAAGVYAEEAAEGSAQGALTSLLGQGAQAILGPVSSTSASAVLGDLAERKSLACSGSATLPSLTADGTATGAFVRTALADQHTISYAVDEVVKRRDAAQPPPTAPWPVAIIARDDDYGRSISAGLAAALQGQGLAPTVISYLPQQVIFTSEVQQAVALSPELVIMVTYEETPRLLDTLIDGGIPAVKIMGLDGAFTPRLAEQTFPDSPERVDGVTVLGSTGSRAFIDRLVEQPGQQVIYGAQLYDCVISIALAAQAAGSPDPAVYAAQLVAVTGGGRACSTYGDCLAQLEAGEDIDYEGVSGSIDLDANGDPTSGRFTTATFTQGQLTEVTTVDIDLAAQAAQAAQQAAIASASFTAALQTALKALGYYQGPIDGIYDDDVAEAVKALQTDLGLPATGEYDEATDAALRARLGSVDATLQNATTSLQQELTRLGYYSGPIDGVYSRAVVDAVKALQADLGVPPTGVLDAATVKAAYDRGLASQPAPPPTTTAPTTTPATTTVPPTTVSPPESTVPLTRIIDILQADPDLSQLVALVQQAGSALTDRLAGVDQLTVFAPTNAALAALDPAVSDTFVDQTQLANFLSYHLVAGRNPVQDLAAPPGEHPTLDNGLTLRVASAADGGSVLVNEATVQKADIVASNGLVNTIDQALVPPAP